MWEECVLCIGDSENVPRTWLGPLLEKALFFWIKVLKFSRGWETFIKFMETGLFHCRIPYKGALWESVCEGKGAQNLLDFEGSGFQSTCPDHLSPGRTTAEMLYTPIHPTVPDTEHAISSKKSDPNGTSRDFKVHSHCRTMGLNSPFSQDHCTPGTLRDHGWSSVCEGCGQLTVTCL